MDAVDEHDRVLARVPREEVYLRGANFRVAHVFLFDRRGDLLVHQLSAKKRYSGFWGSSAAGGVRAGERPREAARRELREELGLTRVRLVNVGKARLQDEGVTKFLYLYAGVCDDDARRRIRPDAEEIAATEFLPVEVVRDLVRSRERPFTPTFLSAFALFERGALT